MGLISRAADRILSRAAPGDSSALVSAVVGDVSGTGENWAITDYAEYYAKAVSVYACVKLRSDALAKPRLRIYEEAADGSRMEVPPSHPARLMFDRVNPFWTRGRLWRATETALSLWGQAFWGVAKDRSGRPAELWWLRPDRMRVVPSETGYIDGFLYSKARGDDVAFKPDEIVWLPYFNPLNEFTGLSPIASARLSIDTGQDAVRMNRALLKNRATPQGIIHRKNASNLTNEQVEEIRYRWKKALGGPDNAGRIAVLWGDTEYQSIGLSPTDLQYIEGQRLSLEDVCRIYQVPPPLVADLERATYSNTDQLVKFFYSTWLIDELTWILEEINEMLLPRFGGNLVAAFDTSEIEVLREDQNAKADRETKLVAAGRKTINEVRRESGESDLPWGDVWWAPMGLSPVGDSGGVSPAGGTLSASVNGHRERIRDAAFERLSPKLKQFAVGNALLKSKLGRVATPKLKSFFDEQAARVMDRFDKLSDAELGPGAADKLMPSSEDGELLSTMKPLIGTAASETTKLVDAILPPPPPPGTASANGHGTRKPAGTDDPLVQKLLRLSAQRVVRIDDATKQAIRAILAEAADKGYGRFQIANGVPEDGFAGLASVVEEFYANRAVVIARTEMAWASNLTAKERYEERGVSYVEILDGDECGWTEHDDPDLADGSTRTTADLEDNPIAHPNCVRVPIPVLASPRV